MDGKAYSRSGGSISFGSIGFDVVLDAIQFPTGIARLDSYNSRRTREGR